MMEENRMSFPGVGSPEENGIRLLDLLVGIRPSARSENHRQTGDAWSVSGTVAAIDVVAAHHDAREFLRHEVHFVCRLRATEHSKRLGRAFIDGGFQTNDRPV